MSLAWRAALATVGIASGLVLVSCATAPAPTPGEVASGPATGPGTSSAASSVPSASYPPGPTLTKSQFNAVVKSGQLGDHKVALKLISAGSSQSDPDNEDKENQEQSEARSCVAMNKLADRELALQASGDTAVIQMFSSTGVTDQLFALNVTCAAEQAKLDAQTAVTTISQGSERSAKWWLYEDPDHNYQVAIGYGNLLSVIVVDNGNSPAALVDSVASQLDKVAAS